MKKLIILMACITMTGTRLTPAAPDKPGVTYVCPDCGCPDDGRTFTKPGKCPSCKMNLIPKGSDEGAKNKVTVAVLLFDGAQIIDYAGPWEAFGDAGFKVFTVAEKMTPVRAVYGQKLTPDYTFANSPKADILLVPGGSVSGAVANAKLIEWVQKNAASSKHVMSVCTGAFILAKAGLLDGLTATTVSHSIEDLAKAGANIKVVHDQRYVDNGKVITTAGLSSGIDGALHLIAKIQGKGAAQSAALSMEYHWDPDSKYARAALADRYFPDIQGVDAHVMSTEGDADHWELKANVTKPASASEIRELLAKRVVDGTPHAQGPVTLLPSTTEASDNKSEIGWKFTDEQGGAWEGRGTIEPAADQPGQQEVTLTLTRVAGPKSS